MCPIVDEIKKDFANITQYNTDRDEDKKKIDDIANKILQYYNQNGKVEIIKIAKNMGFDIYTSKFVDPNVSGFVSIKKENMRRYNRAKVMKVNEKDSAGHRRFTLAHEIGHYIFDFNDNSDEYFLDKSYKTDDVSSIEEKRACFFAACLLLPTNIFMEKYKEFEKQGLKNFGLVKSMADEFGVSNTAVERRFEELNINYMELES